MKLIAILAAPVLILVFANHSFSQEATNHITSRDWQDIRDREKQQDFVIEKAVENISENITLLCHVLRELDEGSVAGWYVHTADKLPSQPVAVIELMAASNVDVRDMCPRQFYEGTENDVMEKWMTQAVKALSAFTMKDRRKDSIRRQCLTEIDNTLNIKDKLQP